jgi:hypothetical protein
MNIEAILARLQCVERRSAGWIARCPAHKDRNPSLSVREQDGKILLHCFTGCAPESVCDALEINMSQLFNNPRETDRKREPQIVRDTERQLTGLRSRLTKRERGLPVTVVLASETNLDAAIARALALAVEGELVQVALEGETP